MSRSVTALMAAALVLTGIAAGPAAAHASEPCQQSVASQGQMAKNKAGHAQSCASSLAKTSAKSVSHLQLARSTHGHR